MPSKSGGGGRKGVVKWNDGSQPIHWEVSLPTVLDRERNYYEQRAALGESEVDNAVRTWFKVYHSLVWLVAATNQNHNAVNLAYTGTVNCPDTMGEEHCLEESHLVPAFSPEESGCEEGDVNCREVIYSLPVDVEVGTGEVGDEKRKGWIFQDLKKFYSEIPLESYGVHFSKEIYQRVGSRTLLQRFLSKFERLSADFDATSCLSRCLESRSQMEFHPKTKDYVKNGIDLIKDLWDAQQLETHLDEMRSWVMADSDEAAGSKEWLQTRLNLMSIEERIDSLFAGENADAKKNVSRWTAILEVNTTTFTHIYNRFVMDSDEISHGLEAAIENLATTSTRSDWNNLLYATYGAVAWQIFKQADLAARQV